MAVFLEALERLEVYFIAPVLLIVSTKISINHIFSLVDLRAKNKAM